MKLQLCLIALLLNMQSTMHAADEARLPEAPHRRVEAGSNEVPRVTEAVEYQRDEFAVDGGA